MGMWDYFGLIGVQGTHEGHPYGGGDGIRVGGGGGLEEGYGVYFYGPAVSGADLLEEASGFAAADENLPTIPALKPRYEARDGPEHFSLG